MNPPLLIRARSETESDTANPFVIEGRRIVDIGHLSKQLVCPACKSDLKLRNITRETRSGLGSYLYILCDKENCQHLAQVTTTSVHGKVFDVNQKLAICK